MIAVVGGGVSGLTAAYRLIGKGHEPLLLEQGDRVGGKVRTRSVEGFLFDEGPDSVLSRKRAIVDLCRDLGIADRFIGRTPSSGGSFIFHEGRLHPLPEGFSGLVPTNPEALKRTSLISPAGLERMLEEARIDPPDPYPGDESVASFFSRRYGAEAFEVMIEPLVSGIFAGNANSLSIQAAFPHLVERERGAGSLSAGAAEGPRPSTSVTTSAAAGEAPLPPFVSFPAGMEELIAGLSAAIGPRRIRRETPVTTIEAAGSGYRLRLAGGEALDAAAVVVALPPAAAAAVTESLAPRLAAGLAEIATASTLIVNLGYRAAELPGLPAGYGYLSPMADGRAFHGCTWSSQKWEGRAPDGGVALRLYGGRYGESELFEASDREVVDRARRELAETLGIEAEPAAVQVSRWENALPQYNVGYRESLARITEAAAGIHGLFLAGAAYGGVGIPDCVSSGEAAAQGALQYLAAE